MYGGYKNDLENSAAYGNDWRPGLMATLLLGAPFFIIVSSILWEKTKSENYSLMISIVVLGLILGYFSMKFRLKIYELSSTEEKEDPIKFTDLKEYLRWYHLPIIIIYSFIAFAYLLSWLGN